MANKSIIMTVAEAASPSLKVPGGKPSFSLVKDVMDDQTGTSMDKDALIELLTNKYIRSILSLTSTRSCSACELSQELGIPIATVYRKLKLLENTNIIQNVKTIINLSGNEEKYYRCLIRDAVVSFHDGTFSTSLIMDEHSDSIVRLWKRLPAHFNAIIDQNLKSEHASCMVSNVKII